MNYVWIKLHYDLLNDRKVGQLPDSLKWRFIECLLLAGKYRDYTLPDRDGFLPPVEDCAWELGRMNPEAFAMDMSRLAAAGLAELRLWEGDERWYLTNFTKRQEAKKGAERVRAYRARKAKETREKRDSNDTVTSRYTDKIRLDKDKDIDKNARAQFEHPLPDTLTSVITTLAQATKTPYGPGFNEQEFESAAYLLIGKDATIDDIRGFQGWWNKRVKEAQSSNREYPYPGKPALKSLLQEWDNYKGLVTEDIQDMSWLDDIQVQQE